jgi:hypothetical protein
VKHAPFTRTPGVKACIQKLNHSLVLQRLKICFRQ